MAQPARRMSAQARSAHEICARDGRLHLRAARVRR
jgi:hypothetical protein